MNLNMVEETLPPNPNEHELDTSTTATDTDNDSETGSADPRATVTTPKSEELLGDTVEPLSSIGTEGKGIQFSKVHSAEQSLNDESKEKDTQSVNFRAVEEIVINESVEKGTQPSKVHISGDKLNDVVEGKGTQPSRARMTANAHKNQGEEKDSQPSKVHITEEVINNEGVNERLGKVNGNIMHLKPGVEGKHDGQIAMRLQKQRVVIIDYGVVPENTKVAPGVFSYAGAGRKICSKKNCSKVGVPVLLYDSQPTEHPTLYLRSGLCFACQRAENERRRSYAKRKGKDNNGSKPVHPEHNLSAGSNAILSQQPHLNAIVYSEQSPYPTELFNQLQNPQSSNQQLHSYHILKHPVKKEKGETNISNISVANRSYLTQSLGLKRRMELIEKCVFGAIQSDDSGLNKRLKRVAIELWNSPGSSEADDKNLPNQNFQSKALLGKFSVVENELFGESFNFSEKHADTTK